MTIFNIIIIITNRDIHNIIITITEINLSITTTNQTDLCDIVHDDACYISSLGKLAMKFAYLLRINLPQIDPGLFIPRFAQKLDFGAKTHDVTYTALRLVERMDHDWMATGRRPSGRCGAALIVAARMYGFERSLDDIVKVSRDTY